MDFIVGLLIGGAVVILLPPKYKDQLRGWIITQWQKVTKKG